LETEHSLKGLSRIRQNIASGAADLFVGVSVERFANQVQQARVALENGQEG
jgi:hypothetical protein